MAALPLPAWAEEMRDVYRAGSSSQFILYGNVYDLVPLVSVSPETAEAVEAAETETPPKRAATEPEPRVRYQSLRRFLTEAMFAPFDVIIHYDRGRGLRVRRGGEQFYRFLKAMDAFSGTSWASLPDVAADKLERLDLANLLPRDPRRALEIIDRFLRASQLHTEVSDEGERVRRPLRLAVLIDHAHFIAPPGEPIHLAGEHAQTLIRLLDWASDPSITTANVATVLVTESLTGLNRSLVESPYSAKIQLELPNAEEIRTYVHHLTEGEDRFAEVCAVDRDTLAQKLAGLSLVNVRAVVLRALRGGERISMDYLTRVKKELIEKEAFGRIEFIESDRTLDDVAGHREAKEWLRQDAELLRRNRLRAIPMGYLLCGRIGTGKTFLVECWAGEVGIPVVEIKNFRERWVGATEGNLERVFTILRALGQVVVFIDEADQMTGRREGGSSDSGVSGRVYGMLAKEMSDTRNRGRIIWVFATSRPDLLEVDLKRQGRLDVHIPLFPPGDPESRHELFVAMARKVGIDVPPEELPAPPDNDQIGGNEMEGILVRALRLYETQPEAGPRTTMAEVIARAIADVRPSAHVERLELMDLLAVKECTDSRFLPARFRDLTLVEVNRRIEALRLVLGE